jgi:hypothetical protein
MCIGLISATFAFELILFVIVFLLIRLKHRLSGQVTAWSIATASVLFVASFVFLIYLGVGRGCG